MSAKLRSRFVAGGAARDVATLAVGTGVAQLVNLAATPLLTRLYAPEDFGVLAVFIATSALVATFATLRYETAILVPKTAAAAATLVLLSLILAAGLALSLGAGAWLLDVELGGLFGEDASRLLPAACFVGGAIAIIAVAQGWLNRQRLYSRMVALRIIQSAGVVGLALMFGLATQIDDGLVVAQFSAVCVTAVAALFLIRSAANKWKLTEVGSTAKEHRNAPKFLMPTAMLDVLTLQMPVMLIMSWYGEALAGQFSMAWRMLALPMSLIGGAVGQVFLQRFASARDDAAGAKVLLMKTWSLLVVLGFLPMAAVLFGGEQIFRWVLGDAWGQAGRMASVLAPMLFMMFISSPTSGSYIILGLQKYSLFFGLATFVYRPACLYIGYASGNLLAGLALWAFFEIACLVVYQSLAWRHLGRQAASQSKAL